MNFRGSKSRSSVTAQNVAQSISVFCPTDLKYQRDPNFPPDKMDAWDERFPDHITENAVTYYNNALLGEVNDIVGALRSVESRRSLLPSTSLSIQKVWRDHHNWMKGRLEFHKNYFMPISETRIKYPQFFLDSTDNVLRHYKVINKLVESLFLFSEIPKVLAAMESYEIDVITYIVLHENMGLMLYRYYFSFEETSKFAHLHAAKSSTHALGSFIYYNGLEKFRQEILPREFPRLNYEKDFQAAYEKYLNGFIKNLDAIISGFPLRFEEASLMTLKGASARDFRFDSRTSRKLSTQFNPLDPTYQKDPNFPPDKLPEWDTEEEPVEDFWHLMHEAVKGEIKAITKALLEIQARGKVSKWELDIILQCFTTHRNTVSALFRIQRSDLYRLMEERCQLPEGFTKMQMAYFYTLYVLFEMLTSIKPDGVIDNFTELWLAYAEDYSASCDLQELMFSALFHAYFSPVEADNERIAPNRLLKKFPDSAIGCLVAHVGKDHFRQCIMVKEKIGMLDWRFDYGPKYKIYEGNFQAGLKALEEGNPLRPASNMFSRFYVSLDLEEEV